MNTGNDKNSDNKEYYEKYIKYKAKYLKLLNGGGKSNKIFNLLKKHPEFKKNDVQNNLKLFIEKYGETFDIKYGPIILKNVMIKKKKISNGKQFYSIVYDIPNRTQDLAPMIIDFIDFYTAEPRNNSYISNISRTNKISGTEMVKVCIRLNKILGVNKMSLYDGSSVKCDKNNESMNLSYIKLIEKGITFYMKLGFEFELNENNNVMFYYRFNNKKDFMREIHRVINNIRKIKTNEIIKEYNETLKLASDAVRENYTKKLEIIKNDSSNVSRDNIFYDENPKDKIADIISECKEVLDVLNRYKHIKYLYKVMVKTFNDDCEAYISLTKCIVDNIRYAFVYGNRKITKDYSKDFRLLYSYKNWYWFSYTF